MERTWQTHYLKSQSILSIITPKRPLMFLFHQPTGHLRIMIYRLLPFCIKTPYRFPQDSDGYENVVNPYFG